MTVPAQIWAPVINLFNSLRRVTFKNDIKNAHILTQLDSSHCPNFRRQWMRIGNIDNEMIEHNGILRIVSRAPHIRAIDMHVPRTWHFNHIRPPSIYCHAPHQSWMRHSIYHPFPSPSYAYSRIFDSLHVHPPASHSLVRPPITPFSSNVFFFFWYYSETLLQLTRN
jgi:hypothetical protein